MCSRSDGRSTVQAITSSNDINRRRLLNVAAGGVAAAHLVAASSANAQTPAARSFGPLRHVRAGVLNVAYFEVGPRRGRPVILLHGWPYDVHAFEEAAFLLADAGRRVIVPYLRGYGETRFLSDTAFRNGQQSALAQDIIDFMDALRIGRALIAGFDWGARTAIAVAALWPERCEAIVSVSGYILVNLEANQRPLPPQAELGWWYQYYFATERGRAGYDQNRRDFARLIWRLASPLWTFDDATFDRSAAAFDNPDHVDIVIHNYRWRLSLAEGEPAYDALETRLQQRPLITVPAITIGSDFDGAGADGAAYRAMFTGPYAHRVMPGIGHNPPQEAPQAFVETVLQASAL